MDEDTTTVDSIPKYEVPEIIDFANHTEVIYKDIYTTYEITPEKFDFNLMDAFFLTPVITENYGLGQLNLLSYQGRHSRYTNIFINHHPYTNPIFGYVNLTKLPVQFFERILVEEDFLGAEAINLVTKVNHYNRPFSYISFTTGDYGNNIYNIDFTRPITNEFGLYLSGLHWNCYGYTANSDFKTNSFYINSYYNQFTQMRFDFLALWNNHKIPIGASDSLFLNGEDKLIDANLTCGFGSHNVSIFHILENTDYTDTVSKASDQNQLQTLGILTESYHRLSIFDVIYNLTGSMSKIESNSLDSHSMNSLGLCIRLVKEYKSFLFSVSNRGEFFDTGDYFYTPRIDLDVNIIDSTYLTASLSRDFRKPSILETHSSDNTLYPYYKIKGNSNLAPEYCLKQEAGIKRSNFVFKLYKLDFDNFIVMQPDTDGYYIPTNIDDWQIIGIENYLEIPVRFYNQLDTNSMIEISAGMSNNYVFTGDSLAFVPKGFANFFISLKKETERFGAGLLVNARHMGKRHDVSTQEISSFNFFSAIGTIRLMSLSCTIKIDNILNSYYTYIPDYPMAPRHLDVSVRWEFWD
jgi:outer membrane receptor protein involved in Fe transport